jgi:hypothetical protein
MVTYASQTKWCGYILVDWCVGITDYHVDVKTNDCNAQKFPGDKPAHASQVSKVLSIYALDVEEVCNASII